MESFKFFVYVSEKLWMINFLLFNHKNVITKSDPTETYNCQVVQYSGTFMLAYLLYFEFLLNPLSE